MSHWGSEEGKGRDNLLGCVPQCVSVPGLVSRVEKDAVKPEGQAAGLQ